MKFQNNLNYAIAAALAVLPTIAIMAVDDCYRTDDFDPCGADKVLDEEASQVQNGFCLAYHELCCDVEANNEDCVGLKLKHAVYVATGHPHADWKAPQQAADGGIRLLRTARKVIPADTASNCEGSAGEAMGMCVAYYSVQSEIAKAKLAALYFSDTCDVMPGLEPEPFPNYAVLKEATDAYVAGAWDGFIGDDHYGYVSR
jgi:hypothetical protein